MQSRKLRNLVYGGYCLARLREDGDAEREGPLEKSTPSLACICPKFHHYTRRSS